MMSILKLLEVIPPPQQNRMEYSVFFAFVFVFVFVLFIRTLCI